MIGMITIAPRAIDRFGPKAMVVTGMGVLAAGLVWLSFIRPDGTSGSTSCPPRWSPRWACRWRSSRPSGTAISSAPPEEGGLAAGIVNTSYQIGSALGLAAMTAVATGAGAGQLGDLDALTDGFSAAFLGAGVIAPPGPSWPP